MEILQRSLGKVISATSIYLVAEERFFFRMRVLLLTCKWLTSYGENIVESAENVKLAQRLRRFIDQMAKSDAGRKLIREITTLIVQLKRIAEKIAAYNSHRGRSNMPYLRRCPHETEALFPENLIITHSLVLSSAVVCFFALPK